MTQPTGLATIDKSSASVVTLLEQAKYALVRIIRKASDR